MQGLRSHFFCPHFVQLTDAVFIAVKLTFAWFLILLFFKAMKKAVSAKDRVLPRDLKPKLLDEVPGSSPSFSPSLQLAQHDKRQEKRLAFSWRREYFRS